MIDGRLFMDDERGLYPPLKTPQLSVIAACEYWYEFYCMATR